VNRFKMETYIATGKFKDAFAAGETGLSLEDKYVQDLVKQADADAANKKRDRNAPPPIDKNSPAFKTFLADADKTQMYYYQNLMRSAKEANDPAKVIEYGDKALAKMPNDLYSLITVSDVLARRVPSDDKEAEQALKKAEDITKKALNSVTAAVNGPAGAQMSPSQKAELLASVNVTMGLVYFHQKKYDDSQKSMQAALAAKSNDAEAYMLLGMSYANQRPSKADEALDALAKSVYLKGDTEAQARESLTRVYQATKKSLDGLDQFIASAGAKIPQ
jgi:tetratricopeptide (TPR) repeat protein